MPAEERSEQLTIRRATSGDRSAMIDLCRASLGWKEGDPNKEFFAWKHDQNPFGESPAWLALTPDGSLVGLRVLMNWRFTAPGEGTIAAVRAVDTATHPAWQGRGIFSRLTLRALDELAEQGLQAVFNTPNDQSRPGYLKMGWVEVARVPVAVRLRSPLAVSRMAGARAAAEMWSGVTDAGVDAAIVVTDTASVGRLLERLNPPSRIATARSVEYLQWRYSFAPLRYRALPLGDDLRDGLIVFRVRARGTATELTVCEVLSPGGARVGRAVGHLLRRSGADYAIVTQGPGTLVSGFVPAPKLGPILTWREVGRRGAPEMGDLALTLGDVELF